jgi:hypothetical protein
MVINEVNHKDPEGEGRAILPTLTHHISERSESRTFAACGLLNLSKLFGEDSSGMGLAHCLDC